MRELSSALVMLAVLVCHSRADEKNGLDDEGFVQRWVVLAPIPFTADQSAVDAYNAALLKDEAKLKPAKGQKVKVGEKELTWQEYKSATHLLDFNSFLGAATEDATAYAVTYISSPEEMKVKMKTGSDDQCKVFLNGEEVFKHGEERAADKDQDTTEVTLKKGVNVLVVKVVNSKIDWSFCVRFVDADDKPVTTITAKSSE